MGSKAIRKASQYWSWAVG